MHQVEATDLGRFTGDGRLRLAFEGRVVGDLDVRFLHDGLPKRTRLARVAAVAHRPPGPLGEVDCAKALLALLASPDVTSKEEIVRQYDHEVLAGSAVKPMVGPGGFGPSDGCIVAPRLGSRRGVVVGCGLSPTTGALDPHSMALLAVDEAVRNVVALDDEEALGSIARCAEGCRDAALAYGAPFISGKDSLHNQTRTSDGVIRIPPTLLVSALTLIDDVTSAVTMDAKAAGNLIVLVGTTRDELGGSRLLRHLGRDAADPGIVRVTPAARPSTRRWRARSRRRGESATLRGRPRRHSRRCASPAGWARRSTSQRAARTRGRRSSSSLTRRATCWTTWADVDASGRRSARCRTRSSPRSSRSRPSSRPACDRGRCST